MNAQEIKKSEIDSTTTREFLQKYSLEKAAHEKKKKIIERQKKHFVRQHSKDENEVKQILQRLQIEQHILEGGETTPYKDGVDKENEDDDEDESEEVFVNPYPVTFMPKFSSSKQPSKGGIDFHGGRTGRRKSLEYEDLDNPSVFNATHNRASRASVTRKISASSDPADDPNLWVGDPEYISSIRRPRKSTSDVHHQKLLKRTLSDVSVPPLLQKCRNAAEGNDDKQIDPENAEKDSSAKSHNRKGSLKGRKSSCNEPIYENEGVGKTWQRKNSFPTRNRSASDPQNVSKEQTSPQTQRVRKLGTAHLLANPNDVNKSRDAAARKSRDSVTEVGTSDHKSDSGKQRVKRRSLTETTKHTRHGSLKTTDTTGQSVKKSDPVQTVSNSKITCFIEGDPIGREITFDT